MRRAGLLLLAILAARASAPAQDLEPRAYSAAPVGMNFAVAGYAYSTGNVVTDPSLPISDVEANINGIVLGYVRTFGLLGRQASSGVVVPYLWGNASGNVGEERREITRSGLGDLRARVSVNLLGVPALSQQEFAKRRPRTSLGASLIVGAPTGQYDPTRLINLGTNRWSFKPELGLAQPMGPWVFELYGGCWFYTANDDFFGGVRRTQAPLGVIQAYVSYTFRPGLWLSFNGTWYSGGATTLDGVAKDDRQDNTRVGVTLAVPLGRHQAIKVGYATGATTRLGQNFDTYAVLWQYRWLGTK